MRHTFLFLLLFCATSSAAGRAFDFGLTGRITITKADRYLDGGSVSVNLRDEHGTEAHVFYTNDWMYGRAAHGGQFSWRTATAGKPVSFRRHGTREQSLLAVLRSASVATFGTSDPQALTAAGGWDRLAVSSLFRQTASRHPSKNFE